jgi:hypothetical protein
MSNGKDRLGKTGESCDQSRQGIFCVVKLLFFLITAQPISDEKCVKRDEHGQLVDVFPDNPFWN